MPSNVVIINAFEPGDFFISHLSSEYNKAVVEEGASSEILYVGAMDFATDVLPDQYTYDTLEKDLQDSVEAIKTASIVAIFTSYKPVMNPAFAAFITRLFHLKDGGVNKGIWGPDNVQDKKVRIITVIDDYGTWRKYKFKRDASVLPIHKIDFNLFGFDQISTATFGYLQDNILNEYALKQLAKMHRFGTADITRQISE